MLTSISPVGAQHCCAPCPHDRLILHSGFGCRTLRFSGCGLFLGSSFLDLVFLADIRAAVTQPLATYPFLRLLLPFKFTIACLSSRFALVWYPLP